MPKVCVLEVEYSSSCDECQAQSICLDRNGTDWEEVTEEELAALHGYAADYNRKSYHTHRQLLVVREVPRPMWEKGVKAFLQKAKEHQAKEQEQFEKKKAAEEKRRHKLAKIKEAKDKKTLKDLLEKYPDRA